MFLDLKRKARAWFISFDYYKSLLKGLAFTSEVV